MQIVNKTALLFLSLLTVSWSVVQAQCTANAGPDKSFCTGSSVQIGALPNAATGTAPISYSWAPATGLNCTNCPNPSANPGSNQTYTLTITDGSGCIATDNVSVTVSTFPTAAFTFPAGNPCANLPIQFTNTSTGAGLTYQWNFGDPASGAANTSTLQNPLHVFTAPGATTQNFTVTLVVTNASGCTNSVSHLVTVKQTPGPELVDPLTNMRNCDGNDFPMTVFNTSASNANSNYIIQWDDGSPDFNSATFPNSGVSHNFSSGETFDLLFIVTGNNGCTDSASYSVANITNPAIGAANPGGTTGCGPLNLCFPLNNFGSNHPTTHYVVDYGDGSPLETLPHPPPATICHSYTESSCGEPGNAFVFSIKAVNQCDSSEATISPIRVFRGPQADLEITDAFACVGVPVAMINTSVTGFNASCSNSTLYNWDFGDGTTLTTTTQANPLHTYTAPGTYTVTLTATNSCGSSNSSYPICVEAPPVPDFTLSVNAGCAPFTTQATDISSMLNTCSVTKAWSVLFNGSTCLPSAGQFQFTGGTNAASLNPQIEFLQPGEYTVVLTMTNSCGPIQFTQPVTVQAPPQIALNALAAICAGTDASPDVDTNSCYEIIDTYAWTFPGGSPATASTLVPGDINYATDGSYTISLTVANACGTASANTPLVVTPVPPALNPQVNSPVCAQQPANFTSDPAPNITYNWTGPGTFTATTQNFTIPAVTAADAGTYTLTGSIGSCPGPSTPVTLVVDPIPTVVIAPPSATVCAGTPTVLTASGADTYTWNADPTLNTTIGDVVTATPLTTTTYTVTGATAVCPATATVTITVNPLPVVDAGPDTTLCDQPIPVQLNAMPAGGTWSGPNVSASGVFTPAGAGTSTLTYDFTDVNGCFSSDTRVVTVVAPVFANAGGDFTVCANDPNVPLTGTPNSGTWSGNGVSPAGVFDPTIDGIFPLVYSLGAGSCLTTDTLLVTVDPLPAADAGSGFVICVDGDPVPLNGAPAGGTWTGNGITGTDFNPPIAGSGSHILAYSVTDPVTGCTNSAQITATVNPQPVVDAGADTTICDQPVPVQFNGTPSGGSWSGSNISPTGVFTPTGIGTFVITYTFISGSNCTGSDSRTITITTPVQADAGPNLATCIDAANITLNGTPVSGTWSGANVTPAGIFDPTTAGTFPIVFSTGSGNCLTTDTMLFTVNPLPVVNAGPDLHFCPSNQPVDFTATPAGGAWSGTGITNTATGTFDPAIPAAGQHPEVYAFTDPVTGCINRDTLLAIIHPTPVPGFTFNPVACIGVSETFTNTSTFANTSAWDFGDGTTATATSPTHSYATAGFFDIKLIATSGSGCMDSITQQIEVREPPVAHFTVLPDSACGPVTVSFTNNSTGQLPAYSWNFGNSQTSTLENPADVIYNSGILADTSYTVTLSVTNFCGTDTHTDTIIAMPSPTAIFGTNTNIGCSPLVLNITNNSIGLPDSYSWDFGDGTTGSNGNGLFQHTFTTGAEDTMYTIMLAVSNECGSDTMYHSVTVLPVSVNAFFNVDDPDGCVPHTVNLTQFSTGGTFYSWDFGDGNSSSLHDPSHTFTQAGTYTVSLFVNDGCGYDTATVIISVFPAPNVAFSSEPDSVCIDQPFTFTNLSTGVASVSWDFGDGQNSPIFNPTYAYSNSGLYQVTLTGISQTNGCSATATHPVVVSTNPVAAFTYGPNAGCVDLTVAFVNNSTNADFRSWDFGDGNSTTQLNPTHTYTTAGSYTVKLYVENVNGCADSIEQIVTVHPLPVAEFTVNTTNPCQQPVVANMFNNSTGAVNFEWDFGNGNTSSLSNPFTIYNTPGTYTVQLTATTLYGCVSTISHTVDIYQAPTAGFTLPEDTVCVGEALTFNSTSIFADSVMWNFGNGTTYAGNPVSYAFDGSGTFPVTIIAYGEGGCTDTLTVNTPIVVHPSPVASFDYVNVQNPDPLSGTVEFENTSTNDETWFWEFGNGDSSYLENPVERYRSFGDFYVTLIAYNHFGCSDTITDTVRVEFFSGLYIPNAISPGNSNFEVANFIPKGVGLKTFELLIYDDWGNLIWETTALDADGRPTEFWDGTYNGTPVQQDAYVWKATATFMNDRAWEGKEYPKNKIKRAGTITVIR